MPNAMMVLLQLAIVILKAQWKKFAMMQRAHACAKKGLGVPDATNACRDGLIIPIASLVNAQKTAQHQRSVIQKLEIALAIQITVEGSVTHALVDFLDIPNVKVM